MISDFDSHIFYISIESQNFLSGTDWSVYLESRQVYSTCLHARQPNTCTIISKLCWAFPFMSTSVSVHSSSYLGPKSCKPHLHKRRSLSCVILYTTSGRVPPSNSFCDKCIRLRLERSIILKVLMRVSLKESLGWIYMDCLLIWNWLITWSLLWWSVIIWVSIYIISGHGNILFTLWRSRKRKRALGL